MSKRSSGLESIAIEWSPSGLMDGSLLKGNDVIVALPRRSSFIKAVRVPNASSSEVAQVLQMQIAQLLPLATSDAAFDFRLTDDVNAEGRLAVVCAVKSELLRRVRAQTSNHDYHSIRVIPLAFGSCLIARSMGVADCAVIENSDEGLSIDIIKDGELRYSRQSSTTDVSEIEGELARTYSSAGVEPGEVITTGGLSVPIPAMHSDQTALEALAGPDAAKLEIALEAPEELAARHHHKLRARMKVAVATLSVGLILSLLAFFDHADAAMARDAEAAKVESTVGALREVLELEKDRVDKTATISKSLIRAFEPAQPLGDVIVVVSAYAPEGLWLTGINLERGRPLQIRGTSKTSEAVSALIERLSADPRFRDVTLSFANNSTIEEVQVVQFAITAHVVGNIPLVERPGR